MKVEKRSIDFIPEAERHGEPRSLFFVWFGANANITTVAAGVLPISMGLNLFWSALSILLGSLIGAIFMASHSAQGPRLGIPQMIQSRAQFGVFGAIVPLLFVMLIYLGFFVSNTLLAAQAIASASPFGNGGNIALLGGLCFLVALFGYQLIHRLQKLLSLLSIAVFGIATLLALALPMDAGQWSAQGFNLASFLASVSIAVTWQLSYAPYVADYSRYLPTRTSTRQVFWYSYAGTVIGGSWMMLLGAVLAKAIAGFSDNVGLQLLGVLGGSTLLAVAFVLYGQIAINVFNLYGAFMSTVTVIEPFAALKVTPGVRAGFMLVICGLATALCTLAQDDFIQFFLNFIFFMSYFLIPWTAINLVDYYALRKGVYQIADIFDPSGIYGRVNWIAVGVFLATIALEIPFMNTSLYVGPVAASLQGIDLAWLVGLLFPAACYYVLMSKRKAVATGTVKT
ncbi:cytosine permease [Pseudomonas sp. CC120222-01a]|uniref:purine-cytosine permease family protein n=1 Tax=Pseudomonas sp. CC120222-01a TaxID=1378075 RepID=UPI000D95CF5D|nr:cytosine permease [Pseudomonas sp. CC120222-01a]PVZ42162.1 NCS1 family nucleobase:cation symporter-1 [Pseudomonas sp. CC120222-01a]